MQKLGPESFIKIKIEHISGSTVWNVMKIVCIVSASRDLPKFSKTMVLTICFYPRQSFFIKQNQIWNYLIFCMIFKEEYFYSYILLTDQISLLINWPNLLLEILDNMCIVIFVMQSVTSKINHCFLNKLFFHITTRSGRAFNMK